MVFIRTFELIQSNDEQFSKEKKQKNNYNQKNNRYDQESLG